MECEQKAKTALSDYRRKMHLTQRELSKIIGTSPSTIAMWESGARKPDLIMLKKLSIILCVTTDELLAPIEVEV